MMTVKEYALDVNKDVKVILEKCASLGFDKYKEDDLLTEEEVIDLDNAVYSEDDEEEKLIDKVEEIVSNMKVDDTVKVQKLKKKSEIKELSDFKNKKKEIVKMLINQSIDTEDENELIDLLVDKSIAMDVDKVDKDNEKFGDKVADKLTEFAGSWGFIIGFSLFLIIWILLNVYVFLEIDPYPFVFLNLLLSCIAALQAPIIMMSQNRSAKKDSMRSKNDYKTDLKSELILEDLHDKMETILKNQKKILKELEK